MIAYALRANIYFLHKRQPQFLKDNFNCVTSPCRTELLSHRILNLPWQARVYFLFCKNYAKEDNLFFSGILISKVDNKSCMFTFNLISCSSVIWTKGLITILAKVTWPRVAIHFKRTLQYTDYCLEYISDLCCAVLVA